MIFHLAIPSKNLEESALFYKKLGAKIGRRYKTHIVMDFFGHQLVCHLSGKIDKNPEMYPRHFGIIVMTYKKLMELWLEYRDWATFFQQPMDRHKDKAGEHRTFFLVDPSNNLIEFKAYKDPGNLF